MAARKKTPTKLQQNLAAQSKRLRGIAMNTAHEQSQAVSIVHLQYDLECARKGRDQAQREAQDLWEALRPLAKILGRNLGRSRSNF